MRKLRTALAREGPDGVMAYQIFMLVRNAIPLLIFQVMYLICLWWQEVNASADKQANSENQRGTPPNQWPCAVSSFYAFETSSTFNHQTNDENPRVFDDGLYL